MEYRYRKSRKEDYNKKQMKPTLYFTRQEKAKIEKLKRYTSLAGFIEEAVREKIDKEWPEWIDRNPKEAEEFNKEKFY